MESALVDSVRGGRSHPHAGGNCRRWVHGLLAFGCISLACGAPASHFEPSPRPSSIASPDWGSLRSRPLVLPTLAAGEVCPESGMSRLTGTPRKTPGFGFGAGPVYLSGQTEWYSGVVALLMTDVGAAGHYVLVRGRQLNGPQGSPLVGGGGEVRLDGVTEPPGWNLWEGRINADGPGCFGLQADGESFTETIVFRVRPGRAPGG
jgi:hypothetical protein